MNPAPLALVTPAPIPNGSAMSYDSVNNALWYMAGSNLVEYFTISGNPNVTPVGVTADAGLSLDPTNHPWYVDNVNNVVCKYNGSENCYTLESGSLPFDILSNGNGTFITDHGTTPAILQLDSSGNIQQQITVPNGAVPWYMMADNAQPGIIWFDYLINGNQIGLARMDTNSAPPTFTMATDPSSPSGSQPGAIGTASNGLVYMVFENTDTLIQVQR
jgi:streptogramin lyase